MLAAGIVQGRFAGETGEGEGERRREDDWRLLLPLWLEILPFLALEFLSQNTSMRMRIKNIRKYTYIYIYRKWFPLQGELVPLTNNVVFSY